MADERHRPVIVDDLHGMELYATEVSGFTLAHGNVTLTLSSLRASWDDEGIPNKRVVVGRIVLPSASAQVLALELYDFLKSRGLDPAPMPEGTQVQ
jgi:hypothetical protein